MITIFIISILGVGYAYFGYPLVLYLLSKIKDLIYVEVSRGFSEKEAPAVTVIIPVHNEELIIASKLRNTLELYYPGNLQIVVVSDGSTDSTVNRIGEFLQDPRVVLIELNERKGKAQALNHALKVVNGEIVVFSDASIVLHNRSVWNIVQPFSDMKIGCVSGEDHIEDGGGEGLYGKYELFLRDLESRVGSIVGASGSFYAERTRLVEPFLEGLAPDFLSVMNAVEKGYRVISCPAAQGSMQALKSNKDEFKRKVRTLIRGMTALFKKRNLLNPVKFPMFSFFLWSHKLMRWLVPFFMIGAFISCLFLLDILFYRIVFGLQIAFYLTAIVGFYNIRTISETIPGKIALYFTSVNIAILFAWVRYLLGTRQELWTPTKRN